jgi:hypothetical protein
LLPIPPQLILKMRRLKPTITIDHLKKVLEGISENKREELKHKVDEDFGLLELATNAGKSVKKNMDTVYCSQYLHTDEQLGIDRIRLMTRMTTQQLRLVPIE